MAGKCKGVNKLMNRNKKKFSCPYCGFEFLRGSRGYGNHLRARHPDEYSMGLRLYTGMSAASWPFIAIHPRLKAEAPRVNAQLTGLDEYYAQFNEAVGWEVDPVDPTVQHPLHYGGGDDPYEAIKVIHAWGLGFDLGNVLKYIRRADSKGTPIQDLEKAKFYLEDEIQRRRQRKG